MTAANLKTKTVSQSLRTRTAIRSLMATRIRNPTLIKIRNLIQTRIRSPTAIKTRKMSAVAANPVNTLGGSYSTSLKFLAFPNCRSPLTVHARDTNGAIKLSKLSGLSFELWILRGVS